MFTLLFLLCLISGLETMSRLAQHATRRLMTDSRHSFRLAVHNLHIAWLATLKLTVHKFATRTLAF